MPQPQSRSGPGRGPARLVRGAAVAGSLALLPLTAACSAGEADPPGGTGASKTPAVSAVQAGVVAPAKVEVIAGLTDCKVKIRTEADELREGACHTKDGDYLITTFPEERYQQVWLETISMYQGTYLVGSRWVISAQPKMLKEFRPKVGGEIVHLSGMGPSSS